MKQLILIIIILSSLQANSMSCKDYYCTGSIAVNGTMTNQNYNGDQCFSGSGTISNSVNFNGWNNLSFSGSIVVQQTINFGSGAKKLWIQPGAIITINYTSLDGYDTIFNAGTLKVVNYKSNNSFTNVIMNAPGSSLIVAGNQVNAPDTLNSVQGNGSNILVVASCNNTPLTINYYDFVANRDIVSWNILNTNEINSIELQRSSDGKVWMSQSTYLFIHTGNYKEPVMDSYYRLKFNKVDGISYSNTITASYLPENIEGTIYYPSGQIIYTGIIDSLVYKNLPRTTLLILKQKNNKPVQIKIEE